jgi:hypothetical protein
MDALGRGLRMYLDYFEQRPALTRAYFVELPLAGARAAAQRDETYERFKVLFRELARRARVAQPDLAPMTSAELSAAVFAPTEIVAERVRRGELESLRALEPELLHLLVKLLSDDATARREAPLSGLPD